MSQSKDKHPEKCTGCGADMKNAGFLSQTFWYSGGIMVFKCECGHEVERGFVPVDILTDLELVRVTAVLAGLDKDQIDLAMKYLKVVRTK